MNTQAQRLLAHLKEGGVVTRFNALAEFGIFELSARVIDLENAGYVISRDRIQVNNRWGEKVSVCRYWMDAERAAA